MGLLACLFVQIGLRALRRTVTGNSPLGATLTTSLLVYHSLSHPLPEQGRGLSSSDAFAHALPDTLLSLQAETMLAYTFMLYCAMLAICPAGSSGTLIPCQAYGKNYHVKSDSVTLNHVPFALPQHSAHVRREVRVSPDDWQLCLFSS